MTRPRVIIDGRKDAEWLHGGRNWFVADPPRTPRPMAIPPEAFRSATISYLVGFSLLAALVFAVVALIGWAVG